MSLRPDTLTTVPEETVRIARAAFPKGTLYIHMRDELDVIYADEQFRTLFPIRGRPAEAPWRLALVTIFQFAENLSDRQAADAVRSRIDWKYALSLELTDPGFDASVLSEFRSRLVGRAATLFLDVLLERLKTQGLLKSNRQRTDSTHVLAAVSALNGLELVRETMRLVLETLAVVAPTWLQPYVQSAWRERYPPILASDCQRRRMYSARSWNR